jgi:hypothetical protein
MEKPHRSLLTWNEERRPANNDKVVFPSNVSEAHGGSLQENQSGYECEISDLDKVPKNKLTSKLTKERKAHANRTNLSRENL